MNRYRRSNGFTLIEIMIVVAIVAILAAIAYPTYKDSVFKGRRAEGRAALAELLQQEERYMTQNNTYLKFGNSSGTTTPPSASATFKVFSGATSANPAYWLQADFCATGAISDCVVVTAVPVQADPQVGSLSISSTGVKSCSGTTSNPKACWP